MTWCLYTLLQELLLVFAWSYFIILVLVFLEFMIFALEFSTMLFHYYLEIYNHYDQNALSFKLQPPAWLQSVRLGPALLFSNRTILSLHWLKRSNGRIVQNTPHLPQAFRTKISIKHCSHFMFYLKPSGTTFH